ncbi:MAG TPA: hypothetical protein VLD57_09100, partial [Blastocatellia bacterium]|nr:hypothetical protein [Blastocatellia bacterium]
MTPSKRVQVFLLLSILSLIISVPADAQKSKGKSKKEKDRGTPVLWREPGDIASRDLYNGPGGDIKPDLSRVTFVEKKTGGYSTKYRVRDGSGDEWIVKVGKEAQSDTVASRLLWAIGYGAEI